MVRFLTLLLLLSLSSFAQAQINEEEFINALELNETEALAFREEVSQLSIDDQRQLTVCGSLGGGVVMAVDIFRCHDVQNNDYIITFKGFGLSLYAKAGIVYIHSKHPILPGFYRAHEVGLHAGFGGYSIKLKNKETHFTIRGMTYGVGMALSFGKAIVKVLN